MKHVLLLSLLLVVGCATQDTDARHSNSVEEQGDRRIGEYISSQWSFHTASYWIEGPDGLILIDAQFLPTHVLKILNRAQRVTGKKVKLAIVLGSSPDRFNGTEHLQSLGIPVVTSEQIRALIPAVHQKWAPVFFEKYSAGRYPRDLLRIPDAFGNSTQELSAAGITVKAHVLGAGASGAHVVVEWEKHLFVGDLVTNGAHGWFEGGRSDEWLERLDELRALNPKWIHPGYGMTGGLELLDHETEYVNTVVSAVAAEKPRGRAPADALARITDTVTHRYPAHINGQFLNMFLTAEWARQAAEAARQAQNADAPAAILPADGANPTVPSPAAVSRPDESR